MGPLIDSLCLSADIGAPPSALQFTTNFTITTDTHTNVTTNAHISAPPLLDFVVDVPDVSHHGVSAPLQVPGGQGQLDVELLHVVGLGDGRQSVGAPAQQEVTERSLNRGHIRREEGVLNLESQKGYSLICKKCSTVKDVRI